jgi:hypothetical protein
VSELIYIGGVSGGIDSQAAARFMLNRYGSARGDGTWNRSNVGRPRLETHPLQGKTRSEIAG